MMLIEASSSIDVNVPQLLGQSASEAGNLAGRKVKEMPSTDESVRVSRRNDNPVSELILRGLCFIFYPIIALPGLIRDRGRANPSGSSNRAGQIQSLFDDLPPESLARNSDPMEKPLASATNNANIEISEVQKNVEEDDGFVKLNLFSSVYPHKIIDEALAECKLASMFGGTATISQLDLDKLRKKIKAGESVKALITEKVKCLADRRQVTNLLAAMRLEYREVEYKEILPKVE
jgi:hypothetical protein